MKLSGFTGYFLSFPPLAAVLRSFKPAASSALGHGPRNAFIRESVTGSKSSFLGSLPVSRLFSFSLSTAHSFFSPFNFSPAEIKNSFRFPERVQHKPARKSVQSAAVPQTCIPC